MSIKKDIRKIFSRERSRKPSKIPFIFLEEGEGPQLTAAAKKVLSGSGVDLDEFISNIEKVARHIDKLSLSGVETVFIKVPGDERDMLVYLSEGCARQREKYGLTLREREVINCLITGTTNREIAECLHISTGTVKTHLDNIYMKLGVSSRLETAVTAVRKGLICPCNLETRGLLYRTAPQSCPLLLSMLSDDKC